MSRIGRPLAMPVEDRRKEIFSTAEQLFGERGYEKVTMAEIAAACGMSKKTLYVSFADKEALLKALVASSYIWPEHAFDQATADPVARLRLRLQVVAEHVLSERHIKLCRLAIGESIGIAGLADTFYQMGLHTSRESLIQAVEQIPPARRHLALPGSLQADMLFGAICGKGLFDALLTGALPQPEQIGQAIDEVVGSLFGPTPSPPPVPQV
jgi:AcrR family transcriptional regulator